MLSRKDDLQRLAIVRPTENSVRDTWRLNPARTFLHGVDAMSLEFALEPTFEDIHELELNVVMVPVAQRLSERCDHPDHMRSRQSASRRRNAEISVCRI